jgi:hypothetical protein
MTEEIIKIKQEFLDKMSKIDVKPYLFVKGSQSYLPWSRCEELLKLNAPDSILTEITFPTEKIITALVGETKDGKQYASHVTTTDMPYFTDGKTAFVKVKLEIPSVEITCETTLPIMDFKNQSIPVEKITMNDVNKSLKRCMVKCVAEGTLLGIGLWHKEETSESAAIENVKNAEKANTAIETFKAKIAEGYDRDKLVSFLRENYGTSNPQTIKDADKLNQLKTDLDNLKAEDFKPSKKKESK